VSPVDFWGRADDIWTGLTLREFDVIVQGYARRLEQIDHRVATHAAWLMSMWAKKGSNITADKLLGKERAQPTASEVKATLSASKRGPRHEDQLDSLLSSARAFDPEEYTDGLDSWATSVVAAVERQDVSDDVDQGATLPGEVD